MIGLWIVENFEGDKDNAGCEIIVRAKNRMNESIEALLYLPPYMRKSQCNIQIGSQVFGIMDNATGIGAAICGIGDADFGYFFDADIMIKKGLRVSDDVVSNAGAAAPIDRISLNNHWHGYIDITPSGPTTAQTEKSNTIATIPGA